MNSSISSIQGGNSTSSLKYQEWNSSLKVDWELPQDKILSAGFQYYDIDQDFYLIAGASNDYFPDFAKTHFIFERWGAFLESHMWLSKKIQYKLGFRMDYYGFNDEHVESPRFSFKWNILRQLAISGNWGVYYQLLDPMNDGLYISTNEQFKKLSSQKLYNYAIALELFTKLNINLALKLYFCQMGLTLLNTQQSIMLKKRNLSWISDSKQMKLSFYLWETY